MHLHIDVNVLSVEENVFAQNACVWYLVNFNLLVYSTAILQQPECGIDKFKKLSAS